MIGLLGVKLQSDSEADVGRVWDSLLPEYRRAWSIRHKKLPTEACRESLMALWLVQQTGEKGELHYHPLGRPYLKGSGADFSITHTRSLVLCAVETAEAAPSAAADPLPCPMKTEEEFSHQCRIIDPCGKLPPSGFPFPRVGVDAEDLSRLDKSRLPTLAERWFSPEEQKIFRDQPTPATFLQIWTKKEALVKWLGGGLQMLSHADTCTASERFGVQFTQYAYACNDGSTVVALCHRRIASAPGDISFLNFQ